VTRPRDRIGWQRLADVQVPRGVVWVLLIGLRIRQRVTARALKGFADASSELGTVLGARMREGDARETQLLALQASIERLTRWLVRLTITLGLIGIAGIGATLWAALR
jgi:hypothetical protein